MRILITTPHFWPESMRINDVAAGLHAASATFEVLTAQPNYPDGVVFDGYSAWRCSREAHDGIAINRLPIVPRGRSGAVRLALNYCSFILSGVLFGPWLLRGRRFDIVFVYGISPILSAIPAIFIARLRRIPVVLWVQDLWPESLVVTGFVRNRHLLAAVVAVVKWIYRSCDLILVQSDAFVDEVTAMAGGRPVRVHYNPGEVVAAADLIAAPKLHGEFIVVFAGNLGSVQALETIIDAAELLRDHCDIRFAFVGSGSRSAWLAEQIEARALANCTLVGRLPAAAMPAIFAQADVLLVSLVPNPAMDKTVPSKVPTYMAAGKPIIAALNGEGARVVALAGAGPVSRAGSASDLAAAVLAVHAMSPEERATLGAAAHAFFTTTYSPDVLTPRLLAAFEDVIRRGNQMRR